jgi:hypothetical protein
MGMSDTFQAYSLPHLSHSAPHREDKPTHFPHPGPQNELPSRAKTISDTDLQDIFMIMRGHQTVDIPKFVEFPELYMDYKIYMTPSFDPVNQEKYMNFIGYYNCTEDSKALAMLVDPPLMENPSRCSF